MRTHEKALANALQFQRREPRHRASQSTSSATLPSSPSLPERPSTSSATGSLASSFSLGSFNLTPQNVKSAKLALTPHHLFYLLSRFEELGIAVGPMKIRLENLHDSTVSANYVSFLGNTGRSKHRGSDVGSIHSVSSVRSLMSGMSSLWASLGLGNSISAARTERQRAAAQADLKYLYSAFTKIPCLRLSPDWRACLIRGYEEFPFDSAVPLHAFKNLQALEVSSIDFRQFFGWDRLADQLRSLSLKRASVEDPADILIDIVLDDMDKRRRRTSKTQPSPTTTWGGGSSPRRSPTISHPELQRAATVPSHADSRLSIADFRIGSLITSEHAVDDGSVTDESRSRNMRSESEDPKSPAKESRPRSNSPSRPATSRYHSNPVRVSHRISRSGSGSSHSSISETWHVHHSRGSSGNLLAMGILPASKWRFLRHLSLADNSMTSLGLTSLAPLSNTLFSLDLSSNLFSEIPESLATLTALRALNLSHCMIDSLQSLTRHPLPAITALNLRANRLQSLAGIEKLFPLERLDLRDNCLADPMELARVTGVPDIREIWVDGNPFTRTHKDYRIQIFNLFRKYPGYSEDIIIDGSAPSYSERRKLVERAPIPDSVPVVKPKAPEVPTVDVSKPTIVYGTPKEPAVLRKDRRDVRAVMSETNSVSARRRKVPKRRIVDLATGSTSLTPVSPESTPQKPAVLNQAHDSLSSQNYKLSTESGGELLPPVKFKPSLDVEGPSSGSIATTTFESKDDSDLGVRRKCADEGQGAHDWDASGETYRCKIEALRGSVGQEYLSVLREEHWGSHGVYDGAKLPGSASLHGSHLTQHSPSAQAIHSAQLS